MKAIHQKVIAQSIATLSVLIAVALPLQAAPKPGDIDLTFNNPGITEPILPPLVWTLAVQPDGKPIIGGLFSEVGGATRRHIARLNVDGSLDTTFPFVNGAYGQGVVYQVRSLVLQSDGKVLVGGQFELIDGVERYSIARLNTNGTVDATFQNGMSGLYYPNTNNGINGSVYAMALQPDGKVIIGGTFAGVNETARNSIARLNSDGSLDTTFQNGMGGVSGEVVHSIALQPDGKVLIGGVFGSVNGTFRFSIARLNADGSLDTTFQNGMLGVHYGRFFGGVYSIVLQSDGKVVIGGTFDTVNQSTRHGIARLNTDGSLDTTFQNGMAGVDGPVFSIARQPNGKVLIGGGFYSVNGVSRGSIARLNADGSLDPTFQNGATGTSNGAGSAGGVRSMTLLSDGKLFLGGEFVTVNGITNRCLARLYATPVWFTDFAVASNRFGFNINGESNQTVVVETSTNFTAWTPLATNTLGNTALRFNDPYTSSLPKRFYRARVQ